MKRIRRLSLLLALLTLLCAGCAGGKAYRELSMEEAADWMEQQSGYLLVDVRTREEFESGHIPGAILLPIEDIREGKVDALTEREQTLLLYCRTGRRAEDAAEILSKMGYRNVCTIGGIFDWPGEVVTGNEQP